MARTDIPGAAFPQNNDDPSLDAPGERLFGLMSGHFAGGYDASAARLAMDRKRQVWLDRRGRLGGGVREAMQARISAGERETRDRLDDLARSVAMPVTEPGATVVSGRVLKDGIPQAGLSVSGVDRSG